MRHNSEAGCATGRKRADSEASQERCGQITLRHDALSIPCAMNLDVLRASVSKAHDAYPSQHHASRCGPMPCASLMLMSMQDMRHHITRLSVKSGLTHQTVTAQVKR